MENIFDLEVCNNYINRINNLENDTKPAWGKMTAPQMLAHLNVAYDGVYDESLPKATGFKKFMLNLFVKAIVVGDKPYSKNSRTSPQFLISGERDFEEEKRNLITYILKTQKLVEAHFNMKASQSFGELTTKEWNTLFAKHLNHHLGQFEV